VTSTEFIPRVSILGEVLIQLEDSPHIRLVVLLVFRVHRIQFPRGTRRGEKRATEECREASEGAFQGRCPNVEVVIGIRRAGICVRCSAVLREKLQQVLRRYAREMCKWYEPQNIRFPEGISPFPATILVTPGFVHKTNIP